ncbi:MAG: hypothetical protein LBF78_07745 [Treponema sp.]|jgi:hypothetical protein|nr:hypothetical protein [Treponema sp.]
MKKIVTVLFILTFLGFPMIAQEEAAASVETEAPAEADGGGQAAAQQQSGMPGMPRPMPNVMAAFGMGDLRIDGMIVTGIGVKKEAEVAGEDAEWRLGFLNPAWEENRFELDLHYDAGQLPGGVKFGWFATLWAQNYGVGNFTWAEFPVGQGGVKMTAPDYNQPWMELRYAGFWTSLMDDKIKMTVGRTYDEFYYMPGSKVWKTDGFPFRFTDEKTISMRFEFKPIAGLNFGFQWFGIPPYAGNEALQTDVLWPTAEDAIREIGIGAQYENSLVKLVGGIRFDGAGDPMSKDEAKTYLSNYYGDGGSSIRLWKYDMHNFMDAVPAGTAYARIGPYYKHLDEIMEDPDHFADGTWAFFSLRWKGTPRFNAVAYGALYNITAFDKFGYGRFGENVSYEIIEKKLSLGITFEQEFYGSDVFGDTFTITEGMPPSMPSLTVTLVNSPYIKFTPSVTYNFLPMASATLEGSYGICQDVLEFDYFVKPSINVSLGVIQMNLFYQFSSQKFKSDNPLLAEKADGHKAGLGLMVMF